MAGEEIYRTELIGINSGRFHKCQCATNFICHLLVTLPKSSISNKTFIPLVHSAQVGEAALGKCAYQIKSHGRGVINLDETIGIWSPRAFIKGKIIYCISAIGRQSNAITNLSIFTSWFSELSCHSANFYYGQTCSILKDSRHL